MKKKSNSMKFFNDASEKRGKALKKAQDGHNTGIGNAPPTVDERAALMARANAAGWIEDQPGAAKAFTPSDTLDKIHFRNKVTNEFASVPKKKK